jgi:PIN domain nuclease of toxin-antitoxin system
MRTICDTNVLLFWADRRDRLTPTALATLNAGIIKGYLACSDISFWEIALLFRKGRLALPLPHTPTSYMQDILDSLNLTVLPVTPAIAALAESGIVTHGDPGDRLIGATAFHYNAPLITADEKLRATPGLRCIW